MEQLPPKPKRSGALAHRNADGEWVVTCPGDVLFSTATMAATHYYTEESGWKPIFDDEPKED